MPSAATSPNASSSVSPQAVAHNVRRLMARHGMTYDDVVEASGLDQRTVRGIARAEKNPHARTLQRLAAGFGVAVDELFIDGACLAVAGFDRATNPMVDQIVESYPELFDGWTTADFAELASRFGHGGGLTEEGALEAAETMNRKREVLARARVILESSDARLLEEFIKLLYERVKVDR
jgi:transcriptional regulator with XRE-family HTH domain